MINVALSTSVVQRGKSGVATYIFGLLEGLRRTDAEVAITLLGLADDQPLFSRWLDRCRWVSVPEIYRSAVRNIWWHQTKLPQILRRDKIDVLHVPSYRRIVAQPRCPQVVTIHDLAAFALRGKYDLARTLYGKYVVRLLARRADVITTVSRTTADDVERYFGVPTADTHVIWNGIDHDQLQPQSPEAVRAAMARLGQTEPYFIYLARLEHPAKNHVRLIEAFEQFCERQPDARHELLLGGADWHGAEIIHARIAASPRRERIRALGFVSATDLPFWYAGATAMVYPSLFEGFGLPPIEAMACGCPVISSGSGSLAEVVGDAARIVDPLSVESIAAALEAVAFQPGVADELRRAGLAHAAKFSWEKAARAVTGLYHQAAA